MRPLRAELRSARRALGACPAGLRPDNALRSSGSVRCAWTNRRCAQSSASDGCCRRPTLLVVRADRTKGDAGGALLRATSSGRVSGALCDRTTPFVRSPAGTRRRRGAGPKGRVPQASPKAPASPAPAVAMVPCGTDTEVVLLQVVTPLRGWQRRETVAFARRGRTGLSGTGRGRRPR
jgi:hypothetical protein